MTTKLLALSMYSTFNIKGNGKERETWKAISSKTMQKKFEPLMIDFRTTMESSSLKNSNSTGTSIEEYSIAFNPISSITLPRKKEQKENEAPTTATGSYLMQGEWRESEIEGGGGGGGGN